MSCGIYHSSKYIFHNEKEKPLFTASLFWLLSDLEIDADITNISNSARQYGFSDFFFLA